MVHSDHEVFRHDDWLEMFRYFDEEKQVYEYTEGCLMHHQSPFRKNWDGITLVTLLPCAATVFSSCGPAAAPHRVPLTVRC